MSFIFKTVFWLSLAMILIPEEARLGGHDTTSVDQVDLEFEFQAATRAVWAWAGDAMETCEDKPQACKAAADLWVTAWKTVGEIAEAATAPGKGDATDSSHDNKVAQKLAENRP
jgi:hypothetical protein